MEAKMAASELYLVTRKVQPFETVSSINQEVSAFYEL
jgi:hypothetical protein